MKEIRIIASLAILLIGIMISAYLLTLGGVRLPLSHIDWLVTGSISLWIAYRLRKKFFEHYSGEIRDFQWFFFYFGLFLLTLASSGFAAYSDPAFYSSAATLTHRIGHIFFFFSAVFFIRIPLSWYNPKLKNAGSLIFLFLGAVTTLLNLSRPGSSELHTSGINIRHLDPLVSQLIISVGLTWLPIAGYFLYRGFKSHEHVVRMRAIFLGLGLIVITLGGPTHGIAQDAFIFLIADILILSGIVIIASSIFYHVPMKEEKRAP